MRHTARLIALTVLTIAWLAGSPAPAGANTIVLSDFSFDANWSAAKIYDNTPSGSATFAAAQSASGGDPGAYRQTQQFYTGPGGMIVGHVQGTFVIDPTLVGAIESIDFSFDARVFNGGASGGVGYGLLAYQDGLYYIATPGGFNTAVSNAWVSFSNLALTASSFLLIGGTAAPDFSATGSEILFGYYSSNGLGAAASTATVSGLDNYELTITTAATTVPEPATLTLLLAGLAGTMASRRITAKRPGRTARRALARSALRSERGSVAAPE